VRSRVEEKRDGVKERRDAVRSRVEEKRDGVMERRKELRKKLFEKRKGRVNAYFKRVLKRLTVATQRMDTLAQRIASRLSKLEERDIATDIARKKLILAEAAITDARELIEETRDDISKLFETDNLRESFTHIKGHLREVITKVKEARKMLVDAIRATKAGIDSTREVKRDANATADEDSN